MTDIQNVDPRIGTRGEGHTLPGAFSPWGMTSVCPHTIPIQGGYSDHCRVTGFGHVHLSGVGGKGCLGSVTIAAAAGHTALTPFAFTSVIADESVSVSAYRAFLERFGIHVQATVTTRTGLTEFRWQHAGPPGPGANWHLICV